MDPADMADGAKNVDPSDWGDGGMTAESSQGVGHLAHDQDGERPCEDGIVPSEPMPKKRCSRSRTVSRSPVKAAVSRRSCSTALARIRRRPRADGDPGSPGGRGDAGQGLGLRRSEARAELEGSPRVHGRGPSDRDLPLSEEDVRFMRIRASRTVLGPEGPGARSLE